MADTTKSILSLVATNSPRVRELPIKDGQLIFVQDLGRIAFDFKGQRVFYNQIVELNTEAERLTLDNPLSGYYFIIDSACLWFYQEGNQGEGIWTQITEKPKEIIFIGVELPELGQENKLYVDKSAKEISVWDEETSSYIVVSSYTHEASSADILDLFD